MQNALLSPMRVSGWGGSVFLLGAASYAVAMAPGCSSSADDAPPPDVAPVTPADDAAAPPLEAGTMSDATITRGTGTDACSIPNTPGCPCTIEGTEVSCWTGPPELRHVGLCRDGTIACTRLGEFLFWGSCQDQVLDCSSGDASSDAAIPPSDAQAGGGCVSTGNPDPVPAGTIASASATYQNYTPSKAIDGVLTTMWNPGSLTGWLKLVFPSTPHISAVQIITAALPDANDTFTVTGYSGITQSVIGSKSTRLTQTATSIDIPVVTGKYDAIKITATSDVSWIGIFEVNLIGACR